MADQSVREPSPSWECIALMAGAGEPEPRAAQQASLDFVHKYVYEKGYQRP
jgi:hypothetical protein